MAMPTPHEATEKWVRNMKGSQPDIVAGVGRVTVAPTELAAAKKDKMRANLLAAIDDGRWERGLRRISLQDWRDAMLGRGVQRLSAGVDAAQGKVEEFQLEFFPHLERGVANIDGMPDLTLEDNIGRMVAMVRHNAEFQRS